MDLLQNMLRLLRPTGLYRLTGDTLVDYELMAYEKGMNIALEELEILERELFAQTALDYGLALREELFGIRQNHALPLEERREILHYSEMVSERDCTRADLERALRSMGLSVEIVENPEGESLQVIGTAYTGLLTDAKDILQGAQQLLPAHLEARLTLELVTWDRWEQMDFTFDQLDELDTTFEQLQLICR